jgi:hypothetical protein
MPTAVPPLFSGKLTILITAPYDDPPPNFHAAL